jgi:hypothetical protein
LEKLEKKTWRVNFEDGTFEIYLGIIIISFAPQLTLIDILPIPFNILLGPIIIGVALALFLLSKKYLIKPRIGIVKYGRKRKMRKQKTVFILTINMLLLFSIFLLTSSGFWDDLNIPWFLELLFIQSIFVTLPLCLVAYYLQYSRLYIIAVLMGSSIFIAELSSTFIIPPFNFLFVFVTIGGLIILMGTISLFKFLKKYPKEKKEADKL